MKIKNFYRIICVSGVFVLGSCSSDDDSSGEPQVEVKATYEFERSGETTVDFNGQTTRIKMAQEIIDALKDDDFTEAQIDAMFAHEKGVDNFSDAVLNETDKVVRGKTAASRDYFSANTSDATAIKAEFDGWIKSQVDEVFPNWEVTAVAGTAGVIQEGGVDGSKRYVNANGLELNQAFNKGLIGALMADQTLNNYLSTAVLDEADNRTNNDNGVLVDGKNYTKMEHKWDEAYGYLFGLAPNAAKPLTNIGTGSDQKGDDSFLNKYLDRVNDDVDFNGIATDIFDAFKLGRAAIVAKNYTVRDQQATIIREKISEVIGIRAVYYLQQGKNGLEAGTVDQAAVFHDLSEGYGFIYSLQFTRNPNTDEPYFSRSEVQGLIDQLMGGTNGLWSVTPATLQTISDTIAEKFSFTVEQARS